MNDLLTNNGLELPKIVDHQVNIFGKKNRSFQKMRTWNPYMIIHQALTGKIVIL